MKTTLRVLILTIALTSASAVQAIMVTGNIAFTGRAQLYDSSLQPVTVANADGVSSWNSFFNPGFATVEDADGAFAGLAGQKAVIVTPWLFNSGPVNDFWKVDTFTFNLLSSSISSQSAAGLVVTGSGIISAVGYADTLGAWYFSTQGIANANGRFSFSSSTTATPIYVPDSGATFTLLGFGLLILGVVSRRQK